MWSYAHSSFTVHQLPALKDNYIYLIESHNSPLLAVVDPADASPVISLCEQLQRPLTHVLNTHHHWDHTDGNTALARRFGCEVVGFREDAKRIPGITVESDEGVLELGGIAAEVLFVPGHTRGHIAYRFDDALFPGDTLFGAGCGRLFEGTPAQMWQSLQKLAALPDETRVYCAHEYTLPNLRFARTVDASNEALEERTSRDTRTRMEQKPTIPSTIGLEKATNPFLQPLDAAFVEHYAAAEGITADAASVFAHIRERKDRW